MIDLNKLVLSSDLRCVCKEGFKTNINDSLLCDDVDECKTVSHL